ncbi:MAG: SH3 domain-containing protein [Sphingobacteriales bacterium]
MKTVSTLLLFMNCCFLVNAQSFAIINDKDGFVNVRKEKSAKSPIVGTINNDAVFSFDDEDAKGSQWIKVFKQDPQDKDGGGIEGYIYKNRLTPLSKFKSINKVKLFKDSCVAINDSVTVVVKSNLFNPLKHKLIYSSVPGEQRVLIKIAGRHFWGTDGEMPKKVISLVKVVKNNVLIILPKNTFDDLYEPSFRTLKVYFGKNNVMYIEMDNSDGAGAYTIIWIIKDGKYFSRYIDNSMV